MKDEVSILHLRTEWLDPVSLNLEVPGVLAHSLLHDSVLLENGLPSLRQLVPGGPQRALIEKHAVVTYIHEGLEKI